MTDAAAVFYFAAIAAFFLIACGLTWLLNRAGIE